MKKILFFTLFFLVTTLCFGQSEWIEYRRKDFRDSIEKKTGYQKAKYRHPQNTDSVYSFLQEVSLLLPTNKGSARFVIEERPLNLNDMYYFPLTRISTKGENPLMSNSDLAEIAYKILDDSLYMTEPIETWNVSRINENYVGFSFSNLISDKYYNEQLDSITATQYYKKKKDQTAFYKGLQDGKKDILPISIFNISIPMFNYNYTKAIIFIREGGITPYFEIYSREKGEKWKYIGMEWM
ncbi:MAG: hypothetical protein ACK5M3_06800 [Dysgonomonas sp.]